MKGLKIAGIVIGVIALIVLIVWAIRRSMIGKDVKTGVANDKIEKAAIDSGIHPEVAKIVATAPDTAAALQSIGSPAGVANSIAGGNAVPVNVVAGTMLGAVMTNFGTQEFTKEFIDYCKAHPESSDCDTYYKRVAT